MTPNVQMLWILDMVVHAFNPSTQEAEAGISALKASLNYIVSSRTAGATE